MIDYILKSFSLREELGLDDSYIQHPFRDNFYIQRKWVFDCCLFCISNGHATDIHGTWMNLDKIAEQINVAQRLKERHSE